MTINAVVQNAVMLLALCWLLAFTTRSWNRSGQRSAQLLAGLWFGSACIIGMLMTSTGQTGIILDARTVVLSMAGLFGGPLVAAIAGTLAGAYRLWLGGPGVVPGIANILLPIAFGLTYGCAYRKRLLGIGFWQLLGFGLATHLVVLGLIAMLLPNPLGAAAVKEIALPMLLALPLATAVLGVLLKDLLERDKIEQALRSSEARLRAISQAIPDPLLVVDEDGHCLDVICSERNLLYSEATRLRGKTVKEAMPEEDQQRYLDYIRQTLNSDTPQLIEYSLPTRIGVRMFEGRALPLEQPPGQKRAVVWLSRDITERVNTELERRIAAIAFESQQGMLITDAQNRILRVNRAFTRISGYNPAEAIGQTTALLASGKHGPEFYRTMWSSIETTGVWEGEIWNRRKSGEIFPEWLTISAVHNALGKVTHYVAAFTDITDRKAAEERIHNLAFYDPLTNLPNRRLLLDRLHQAMAASRRGNQLGALMFIDLDNFKNINDLHGHQTGDQVLRIAAERLHAEVRASDTVARLGGDEFVVMLENLGDDPLRAAGQAEHIGMKLLDSLDRPYRLADLALYSSASIGVVLFGAEASSSDELMKRADMSMYEAKISGKNTLRFFDPRMQLAVQDRLRLEEEIRLGLKNGEFILNFQPQLEQTEGIVGAEALVRWQHPLRGLLTPAAFIAQAEHAGLIHTLDQQVLAQACAQLARWAETPEFAHLSLSVNLSAHLLYQDNFVEKVLELLERSGADPARLKLELTETLLLDNMPEAIARMTRLKKHGIRFAIDDFGTGYSSMSYLQQLPLDQLKIDQTFIRRLPEDSSSLTIVRAICALATGLNLEVIAEGVESEPQRAMLFANGCHHYQGYLFGRPLSADAFEELVRSAAADDGVSA
ncbi:MULTISPECIES: EAL domain-containing protein [Stutzerimonas stutzeri subgroup]|uniref:Histidine kinase n=2 Tax=Stutzerimonas stutzeri TaxID=316 RepID=A0A0D7E1V6_STUST|nr:MULTISPECIES: EAL domain-containing protein [Stutzerimonas stutzeri subgroup]EME00541.1 sensory box protein [Stutzerimonas stutzeri NF13]KIZ34809.1 histidine kinase [Stutzerimonas stutzeri]MBK3883059.1 EAL domain-containing protein [Stutzerimonas stutzeri]